MSRASIASIERKQCEGLADRLKYDRIIYLIVLMDDSVPQPGARSQGLREVVWDHAATTHLEVQVYHRLDCLLHEPLGPLQSESIPTVLLEIKPVDHRQARQISDDCGELPVHESCMDLGNTAERSMKSSISLRSISRNFRVSANRRIAREENSAKMPGSAS